VRGLCFGCIFDSGWSFVFAFLFLVFMNGRIVVSPYTRCLFSLCCFFFVFCWGKANKRFFFWFVFCFFFFLLVFYFVVCTFLFVLSESSFALGVLCFCFLFFCFFRAS